MKLAVFSEGNICYKEVIEHNLLLKQVRMIKSRFKSLQKGIVSSVGRLNNEHVSEIETITPLLKLNSKTNLPFKNKYKTPKTLGVDRIALVSASVKQFPDKNVLIIDAGTCITYDFINSQNEYLGGAISPGLRTRYKSLNNLTANLPLLELEKPKGIIGASTKRQFILG